MSDVWCLCLSDVCLFVYCVWQFKANHIINQIFFKWKNWKNGKINNKKWSITDRYSVCLSVAYIGPKSRTERPRRTKIGTEVTHVTRDLDTTFKVNRSRSPGRFSYHGLNAAVNVRTYWAWETTLLLLGGARGAGALTGGGEGRGHIVSPHAQIIIYASTFGCFLWLPCQAGKTTGPGAKTSCPDGFSAGPVAFSSPLNFASHFPVMHNGPLFRSLFWARMNERNNCRQSRQSHGLTELLVVMGEW